MFLRSKDGYYKGEVREFAPEAARALLASDRAENPFVDGGVVSKSAQIVVGEQLEDHVISQPVVERIAQATSRVARKRRK